MTTTSRGRTIGLPQPARKIIGWPGVSLRVAMPNLPTRAADPPDGGGSLL